MVDVVKVVGQKIVKEMVSLDGGNNVTGIISDGLHDFAFDVGNEVGIPVYYFETVSPCCFWVRTR
ncbi:7-deoxyloganetic acid glucosyltransferase [Bienertia sinuspersici]